MVLPQVKHVKIQIKNQQAFMDEHFLFSCDRPKKSSLKLGVEHVWEDLNVETAQPLIETKLNEEDVIIFYNFDHIHIGKGLIKSSDQSGVFVMALTEENKNYFIRFNASSNYFNKRWKIVMDGYAASLFIYCLKCSKKYVELVTNHICQNFVLFIFKGHYIYLSISQFILKLKEANQHVMDIMWAKMVCTTVYEMHQLKYALSWLSTLGGAYSALGEKQEKCALNAGRISVEQLRIALRLGDKIIVVQCKLYFSLSLIQRGQCRLAKKILLEQYEQLKSSNVVDRKTLNMCKGIWARLKYELSKRRMAKEKVVL